MLTFVYSPAYYCDIGRHVFPVMKFGLLYHRLKSDARFAGAPFLEPAPVTKADLELVHTPRYIDDILHCRVTTRTVTSELPMSKQIIDAYLIGTGGTLLAARSALEHGGAAMNLTGGFHHSFPDHAEGFCYVNDVAIAIKKLQSERAIERAVVIDCDLHQGNGTAFIFRGDDSVFTFSIHQEHLYPIKEESDLDIGLPNLVDDGEYLRRLNKHLPGILNEFRPQVAFYLAGADPYKEDLLGSLRLTMAGLRQRDELVAGECAKRAIPLAVVVAGGYAEKTEDTIEIHYNTCRVLLDRFGVAGPGEQTQKWDGGLTS